MDFLKTCSTDTQAVAGYDAVEFQAFTVSRAACAEGDRDRDRDREKEGTRAVEARLRDRQQLVVHDAARPWLWLFRAAAPDRPPETPQAPPPVDGYQFTREQFGVMKAAELARPPTNNRAAASSAGSPGHDSVQVYELFTSAIVALVSHYWVKRCNAVALNFRSFLSKPAPVAREEQDLSRTPYCLTNLTVSWAASGIVLVSTFSVPAPAIRCLDELTAPELQKRLAASCIRLAPNGSLAKVVSCDDPVDTASDHGQPRPPRKRVKMGSAEQGVERWKTALVRWLSWKGYALADLEKKTSWIRIRLAQPSQSTSSSPHPSNQSRDIVWPRALCFFYDGHDQTGLTLEVLACTNLKPHPLDWFKIPHSAGFYDPVDMTLQWFLAKPERDRLLEARRRAQKAEEEAARPKEDISGPLFPSSPLNSRTGAYGDLQAISGVYPTPPDGVAPGTTVSHSDYPSISCPPTNAVVVPGGTHPAINVLAPQNGPHSEEHVVTSPTSSQQFYNFNPSGANDDLFEDMEEDDFGGVGVTEDDFNFFDEQPDGDDTHMRDAPVSQDRNPAQPEEVAKEEEMPTTYSLRNKEEMSDPMSALENALASASGTSLEHGSDINMEDSSSPKIPSNTAGTGQDSVNQKHAHFLSTVTVPKEPTPPLSPRHIQQSLLPSPKEDPSIEPSEKRHDTPNRGSKFNPISFSKRMSLSDARYHNGRFTFAHEKPTTAIISLRSLSSIPDVQSLARADGDISDSVSETSSSAEEEEEESKSLLPEPLSAGLIGPGKRKLPSEGNATPLSATSYADSFGGDYLDFAGIQIDEGNISMFEPNNWDWLLTNLSAPMELQSTSARYSVPVFSPAVTSMPNTPTSQPDISFEPADLSRNDCIAVAQVVTEQIVSATLDILHENASSAPRPANMSQDAMLQNAVKTIFPKASRCSLATLVSVPDVFPELSPQNKGQGQQRSSVRKPNDGYNYPASQIISIPSPHIRVRRSDGLWDLLPPALAFWESLGLSPSSLAKNISAICIYPHSDLIQPCLEHFMVNLQIAYEGCKLGNHERVETLPNAERGLVPWALSTPGSTRAAFKSLRETCVTLGKGLAATHVQMQQGDDVPKTDAFVIYIVNPFEDASALWELCSAFWLLFQAYGQAPSGRTDMATKPDLVLQIVPIDCVASFDAPVILDANKYASLAREVYDRCPPSVSSKDKTPLSIYSAPCFQLEETIPRIIQFRLQAEPPHDLLRESSYIHVGYAISLDGNWVTTAWTDNSGKSRTVVSYNLGTQPFAKIAKEMWQTTMEICQARRVLWRVCIAKCGAMDREEIEAWQGLSTCSSPLSLFTTVLTIDTNPPLTLTPTMPTTTPQAANPTPWTSTPGSTPQPGASPDPNNLTPAATPAPDNLTDPANDPDARLVDITDESWGVILSHRLHNTNSTVDFRPCLISGLLVKRGQTPQTTSPLPPTPDPERGPIVVGVNILWINAMTSSRTAAAGASPFPQSQSGDGVSPGSGSGAGSPVSSSSASSSPAMERDRMSMMWTPTLQTRNQAENLLREIMGLYRGLGTLARLKGIRGSRMGAVPWHVAVAKRGVEGLGRCVGGAGAGAGAM